MTGGRHRRRVLASMILGATLIATGAPGLVANAAAADPVPIALVSDSIGLDPAGRMAEQLGPGFRITHRDTRLGLPFKHMTGPTLRAVRRPAGPDIVIAVVGSADTKRNPPSASVRRSLRRFLDEVTPHVGCVRLFEVQGVRAGHRSFDRHKGRINRIIRSVVRWYRKAEYVHYSDWSRLAPRRGAAGSPFGRDGLHLNARGQRDLGRMLRQAAAGCDPTTNVAGFWDVQDDIGAAPAVAWMADQGLARRFPNRTFRGVIGSQRFLVSRGFVARTLWRLTGSPDVARSHGWTDGTRWLDPALDWVSARRLIGGFPNRRFRPSRPLTRGLLVKALWRLAGRPDGYGPHPWGDTPAGLDRALRWASAEGVATGSPDGSFKPDKKVGTTGFAVHLHRYATAVAAPGSVTASGATTAPAPSAPTTGPGTTGTPTTVTATTATSASLPAASTTVTAPRDR